MKKLLILSLALAFAVSFAMAADIYVSPDGTGDGSSAETPTADLAGVMDSATSGTTINLAPGDYSIADHFNQIDIWGAGMTALVFKATGVTLKGAGPEKTTIVVPDGYVGIRMEKDGACVRDLTVRSLGTKLPVNHYNWHMQGAICACNCSGMSVINVAIYSNSQNDGGGIRPFSSYSSTGLTVKKLAVYAPNCYTPVFFNKCAGSTVNLLTVKAARSNNQPAIYVGNWPWGGGGSYDLNNIIVDSSYMPFTVEYKDGSDNVVTVNNSAFYDCNPSSVAGEHVTFNGCTDYPAGADDPGLQEVGDLILTATNPTYGNYGWAASFPPENDDLADAIDVFEGSTVGNNRNATVESGENAEHSVSVWYAFTPDEDGLYVIDDIGSGALSDYDAVLSVYTCEGALSFGNLTALVESQDTRVDESYELRATAGTTYYICLDGYKSSQGIFSLNIEQVNDGPWYVAPGATGSGWTAEDPTGDLALAMNSVLAGQTVNLAPGEYSIADFNNVYNIWGAGMTALCFQTTDVTLKGAGPDKTTIIVPPGYVGIRMEKDGASIQDLTIRAYRTDNMPYHYNFHMQGAICACNCTGMSVSNVAIYSEQKTNEIRPFSTYNSRGLTINRLAVEAPYCGAPFFVNKCFDLVVNKLTVSGKTEGQNPGVYVGNWPYGGGNLNLVFNNILVANVDMPFTVEASDEVTVNNSVFYNCLEETKLFDGAVYAENSCAYYEAGVNDPELGEVDGYILTSSKATYANIGWHTVPEPAVFGLLALVALFLRRK
ncbi:hypothetical protein J6U78_02565 [bacterium]|nr:hypothetical protein [bacterium]